MLVNDLVSLLIEKLKFAHIISEHNNVQQY